MAVLQRRPPIPVHFCSYRESAVTEIRVTVDYLCPHESMRVTDSESGAEPPPGPELGQQSRLARLRVGPRQTGRSTEGLDFTQGNGAPPAAAVMGGRRGRAAVMRPATAVMGGRRGRRRGTLGGCTRRCRRSRRRWTSADARAHARTHARTHAQALDERCESKGGEGKSVRGSG